MEILIQIPPWAVDIWNSICFRGEVTYIFFSKHLESAYGLVTYQLNPFLLILSMVFFWPMWVYVAVTLTTASTWIFWIIASLLLGIIQMVYVTYQFIMIAADVVILTLLKTYQVLMRSRISQFIFLSSKAMQKKQRKTSRRRKWRKECEGARSYKEFLHISISEPKDPEITVVDVPPPVPLKKRIHSFATMKTLHEEQEENSKSSSLSPMRRLHSLKQINSFETESEVSPKHSDKDSNIVNDLGDMTTELLQSTLNRLEEARFTCVSDHDSSSLEFLLSGVVKRNHLSLEDLLVSNARSVAYSGQYEFSAPSRNLINNYYEEVSTGLDFLAEAPISNDNPLVELGDRMTLIRKMKQNMGRTALMLSGGGAQAMYHLGSIRAFIDAKLYDEMKVISGTSGGSITAACCAMYSEKELFEKICVPTVSTDYGLNGEMKKKNIRWFPPIRDMVTYWLKNRLLVDSEYFYRTCEFYYGTTTFAEAFERTGKHVCITVSASRATGGTAQRLLLNHISTPHVTLASAVAASCALPGVMKPAKLQTKSSLGDIEPFEVDGVEWIDGSVQADLPFQRISTLFNVSNYIVCQTNFHVQPFLNKDHHPNTRSAYWNFFQLIEWDIRNRALKLGRLGLFPKIFGQDISKVFKQKYHGNLTLVPRFTAAQTFGLRALVNPSVAEMEGYLKYGQLAAWPYLSVIRDMMRLEKSLDECLERLKDRCISLSGDAELSDTDDLDSIASGTTSINTFGVRKSVLRFAGHHRQVERLSETISKLERENDNLRHQVKELKMLLGIPTRNESEKEDEEEEEEKKATEDTKTAKADFGQIRLSEKKVWTLLRNLDD